jgi:signal transduction histidine kinase
MGELDVDGHAVVDAIDQPTVVVSDDDRILDYNEAFQSLVDEADPASVSESIADYPALRQHVRDREDGIVPVDADDEHYFQVRISEVCANDGGCVGDLVVLHDVTDQQEHQRDLEHQNEQLDKFASLISHDIRNPLDVAIGRTTVLEEVVDDPAAADHLRELNAAHARMRQIIQDVLTLARQGRSIDEKGDVSLDVIADLAWSHVDTTGGRLSIETDAVVRADRERLEQVFENLFRNSIEHGLDSSASGITVRVGELDDGKGFYVADDGCGIADDICDRVLEAGCTGDDGNTGLGLAIVRNVADAHGWRITVTEAASGGARFEFRDVEFAPDEQAVTGSER